MSSSFVHAFLFALLCLFFVAQAMPRMQVEKKAMRNSLVRFGKRAEPTNTDDVFLGESFGPASGQYELASAYMGERPAIIYGLY